MIAHQVCRAAAAPEQQEDCLWSSAHMLPTFSDLPVLAQQCRAHGSLELSEGHCCISSKFFLLTSAWTHLARSVRAGFKFAARRAKEMAL